MKIKKTNFFVLTCIMLVCFNFNVFANENEYYVDENTVLEVNYVAPDFNLDDFLNSIEVETVSNSESNVQRGIGLLATTLQKDKSNSNKFNVVYQNIGTDTATVSSVLTVYNNNGTMSFNGTISRVVYPSAFSVKSSFFYSNWGYVTISSTATVDGISYNLKSDTLSK